MKIDWNNFLRIAVDEFPKEACGFLFSKKPYDSEEEWVVFPVKNVSETPNEEWIPDKTQMSRIKSNANKLRLVLIGNVHTHPYNKEYGDYDVQVQPSEEDLKFARKHNDIVRIILCVSDKMIHKILVHDKFGEEIDVSLGGLNE